MVNIIYLFLVSFSSAVLASMNVRTSDWQFWVLLTCMCGSNICGFINGMKYRH